MTDTTPAQPPYPPPPYAYPYPPPQAKATNGLAVASMVLGILWLYWVGSVLAVVFALVAKRQIRESRGAQGGDGMAVAGLVLGLVGIGFFALLLAVVVIGSAASSPSGY